MNRFGNRGGLVFGGFGITPGVKALLLANVAVFVLQGLFGLVRPDNPLEYWGTFIPERAILGLEVWRFFTYMFLHAGFMHILWNMFGLWMLGTQIEALWGQRNFLIYYFLCGLGGSVTYGVFNLTGLSALSPMLGASGAVFGILLAYGLTFPNNRLWVWGIFPVKAKYLVIFFGLVTLLNIPRGGSTAHLAHLGGMVFGYLFLRTTIPSLGRSAMRTGSRSGYGSGSGSGIDLAGAWRRFQTRRKMKIVRPGNGRDQGNGSAPRDKGQQRIDEILDKISRKGLQSLTDEEQEILRRAGRK